MSFNALVLLSMIVTACGGRADASSGAIRDAAPDATGGDAATDPFAAAGLTLLTPSEQEQIESITCYKTKPIVFARDAGPAICSYIVPDANPADGCGGDLWACTRLVFSLNDGKQYRAQVVADCTTGGIYGDPNNYNEMVLCPSTCAVIMQNLEATLEIFALGYCPLN